MSTNSMPDSVEIPLITDAFFDDRLGGWTPSGREVGRRGFFDPIEHNGVVTVDNQKLKISSFGCFKTVVTRDIGGFDGQIRFTFDFERTTSGQANNVHDTRAFIIEDGARLDRDELDAFNDGGSPNTFFEGDGLSEGTITLEATVDGQLAVGFEVDPRSRNSDFCSFGAAGGTEVRIDTVEISATVEDPVDSDDDGLPDSIETGGMPLGNGEVVTTDPTNPDTDGDGLSDGEEILIDQFVTHPDNDVQYYLLDSNPAAADSSDNGLGDYTERAMGLNPISSNTDGDPFSDTQDYNPLDQFSPNRRPAAERFEAFVEGLTFGFTEAGTIADSPYSNTPEFALGQIIGGLIPGPDKLIALRDAAAGVLNGRPLDVALTAAGAIPGIDDILDLVSRAKLALEEFLLRPDRQLELLKLINGTGIGDQLLAEDPIYVNSVLGFTKWDSSEYSVIEEADNPSESLDLIETIPNGVSPANMGRGFDRQVRGEFFLMTGDRFDYVRNRHITGTVGRDQITSFFPTGARVPAGDDRSARTLPSRMSESDIIDLIVGAIRNSSGTETEITYDPTTDGFGFGITQLKVVVNPSDRWIIHAYPQSGPAVERWTGDTWVTDPAPFPS